MELSDLNSNPRDRKSLRHFIDSSRGALFYPPSGSVNYQILFLDNFHGPTHTNCEQNNKREVKKTKISNARNFTTKPRVD